VVARNRLEGGGDLGAVADVERQAGRSGRRFAADARQGRLEMSLGAAVDQHKRAGARSPERQSAPRQRDAIGHQRDAIDSEKT